MEKTRRQRAPHLRRSFCIILWDFDSSSTQVRVTSDSGRWPLPSHHSAALLKRRNQSISSKWKVIFYTSLVVCVCFPKKQQQKNKRKTQPLVLDISFAETLGHFPAAIVLSLTFVVSAPRYWMPHCGSVTQNIIRCKDIGLLKGTLEFFFYIYIYMVGFVRIKIKRSLFWSQICCKIKRERKKKRRSLSETSFSLPSYPKKFCHLQS